MSCAEIMSVLFFHEMRWDPKDPAANDVDMFVMSKGHAAPILWAALKEAGALPDGPDGDLANLRKIDCALEGHPTFRSPWCRVATGSLGQGLSAAAGMALARRLDGDGGSRVYCLLGDGETAEGAVWEAAAFSAHYGLDNLCAIVDVNRLGQSGPTMWQHDLDGFAKRFEGFGWDAVVVDGHSTAALAEAFAAARARQAAAEAAGAPNAGRKPTALLCRTFKGAGVSFTQDKDGFHGKPFIAKKIGEGKFEQAMEELGAASLESFSIAVPSRRHVFFKYCSAILLHLARAHACMPALRALSLSHPDFINLRAPCNPNASGALARHRGIRMRLIKFSRPG